MQRENRYTAINGRGACGANRIVVVSLQKPRRELCPELIEEILKDIELAR